MIPNYKIVLKCAHCKNKALYYTTEAISVFYPNDTLLCINHKDVRPYGSKLISIEQHPAYLGEKEIILTTFPP